MQAPSSKRCEILNDESRDWKSAEWPFIACRRQNVSDSVWGQSIVVTVAGACVCVCVRGWPVARGFRVTHWHALGKVCNEAIDTAGARRGRPQVIV